MAVWGFVESVIRLDVSRLSPCNERLNLHLIVRGTCAGGDGIAQWPRASLDRLFCRAFVFAFPYALSSLCANSARGLTCEYAGARPCACLSQTRKPRFRSTIRASEMEHLLTPNLTLVLGTAMMTITMALIPVCHVLAMLAVVLAIMGFFMGCIDTVSNVYMIRIYSKDVSPFLQALHFFYGIGAFVSPMIAQPFLLNEDCSLFIDNSSEPTFDQEDMNPSGGGLPATSLAEAQRKTHIDYAFWIMALLMASAAGPYSYDAKLELTREYHYHRRDRGYSTTVGVRQGFPLALSLVGKQWYRRRLASQDPGTKQAWYESVDDPTVPAVPDKTGKATGTSQIILVALLTAAMMFLYDGLQAAYGGYIYSYAVKGAARLPRADAAYLNALFWGMFAMGRLISIALATKLAPALMLLCNVCGCTLGVTLMLCVPWSKAVLIMGTMMMGIFMSSVFPTALSLAEQCIYVSRLITAWLFGAKPECGEDSGLMTQHVRYYSRMRSDLSDNSVDEHESTLTSGPELPATQQAPPAAVMSPVASSGGSLNPFQQ
ncbi:hypothetical protein HPB52_022788 [Rhipicephalus sanguineus]|uniref:Uncharacterized protein n=1 Tax=Rhipicephalus sanguineus TaxID=34632 RepID=A0A9D4T816_RHISA|nr:hypothetical protein HPB52_022788 [Rhipicephalus sanguineus]